MENNLKLTPSAETEARQGARSIFSGVDELIDVALNVEGLGRAPHYRHAKSCKQAISKMADINAAQLIVDMYTQIGKNWDSAIYHKASHQLWRFEKKLDLAKANRSAEVFLERQIVSVSEADWPDVKNWVNQVPVASGLVSAGADRRRAIDLVHKCGDAAYDFIELKINCDTSLYAAMEILKYGVLYLFCRVDQRDDVSAKVDRTKQLLCANMIHLQVLAPESYFENYDLADLESRLTEALADFLRRRKCEFEMDFEFLSFPKVPSDLNELKSETRRLILSRKPVYP